MAENNQTDAFVTPRETKSHKPDFQVTLQLWVEKVREKIKANKSRKIGFLKDEDDETVQKRRLKGLERLKLGVCDGKLEEETDLDFSDLFIEEWIIGLTLTSGSNYKNIKILDLSFNQIPSLPNNFLSGFKNIQTLDLSGNKIATLQDNFLNECRNLQTLDLSVNKLASLPNKFLNDCEKVQSLYLSQNQIAFLPNDFLNGCKNIQTLDLSRNQIASLRDNFLNECIHIQKLNLSWNHIATLHRGFLNECKRIQTLSLYENRIAYLPNDFLSRCNDIQTLDLSRNQIASLQDGFLSGCKKIEELDLRLNQITSFPSNFLNECKNIQTLDLSKNRIAILPFMFFNKIKTIRKLYLANNRIASFRDDCFNGLTNIQTLDLSKNQIAFLPESFKQLNDNVRIDLFGNPLNSPPLEVCKKGIRSIKSYFEDIAKSGREERKRVKVILLGDTFAGKTSLARALSQGKPANIATDDRTIQMEASTALLGQFEIKIIDCGGQNQYLLSHQLFVSNGMLCLLLFDMVKYDAENDYKIKIGNWITMMNAHAPGTPFLLVGTHLDKVKVENRHLKDENCENVAEEIKEHIERIKELPGNPPRLSNDSVIEISAIDTLEGVDLLKEKLLKTISNKDICPLVHQFVPISWSQLEAELVKLNEKYKKNNQIPIIELEEILRMAHDKFKLEAESVKTALCYFHACSSILYFSNIENAKNLVFTDLAWFVDMLKLLYCHNLEKKLNYREQSKDAKNKLCVFKSEFKEWKKQLFSNGIIHETLLKLIFYPVLDILDEITRILENFDFLCRINSKDNSGEKTFFTPWFLPKTEDYYTENEMGWNQYLETDDVIITVEAMPLLPDSIFLRYLTHVYGKSKFCCLWLTGFVAENDDEVLLRVEISNEFNSSRVKFHVRAKLHSRTKLIQATREYVKDFCILVKECPGIKKRKLRSICPRCPNENHGDKELSYGETCQFDWNDLSEEKCRFDKSHRFFFPCTKRKEPTMEKPNGSTSSKTENQLEPVEHVQTGKVCVVHFDGTIGSESMEEDEANFENNGATAKESSEGYSSQARMIFPNDKIALVIGNQSYEKRRYDNLELALNDAFSVASKLTELGFKVISLSDLTLKEMRAAMLAFSRLLGFGMFAVFYYAGHGFELEGENYLMPVDVQNTNQDSCIRAQEYLQEMQNCNTFLNLVIIDCCRSRAKTFDVPPKPSLKRFQKGNTIIAYACCTQHKANEEPNEKNGFYAKYLLKHIHRDTRIENILMDVNTDVMECQPDMQRPTFESDTGCDCRLTAPIKPEMHDPLEIERLHLWQEGSQIPTPMILDMETFVITLEFLPAFSNMMHISVKATGKIPHVIKDLRFIVSAFPNVSLEDKLHIVALFFEVPNQHFERIFWFWKRVNFSKTSPSLIKIFVSLYAQSARNILHKPLSVEQDRKTLELNPEDKRIELGFIRVFKLQKLYNETVFLSFEFITAEESMIKKIDLGTPLISGITSKFDEWAKDRQ